MSYSRTQEFTITNAKYLASKVMADLRIIRSIYGAGPTESRISEYGDELSILLNKGYLSWVKYGFRRNGNFIVPSLQYTVASLLMSDDDPGRIPRNGNVAGAYFGSYLTHTPKYDALTQAEINALQLPFPRQGSEEPGSLGTWSASKIYSSGGVSLPRRILG